MIKRSSTGILRSLLSQVIMGASASWGENGSRIEDAGVGDMIS